MKLTIKLLCFGVMLMPLFSFRWPLADGRVTSSFGESRGDHFHDGLDVVCADDMIYPVEDGDVMFFWDGSLFPLDNEPGGGNFAVVSHASGMCSVYMHLKAGSIVPKAGKTNEQLAIVGNSGHSFAKHLHFSLVNTKDRVSVNPLSVLPKYDDAAPPKIGGMYFKIAGKYMQIRDNAAIRLTRHYPILIDVTDSVTGREKLGIYTLKAIFNGRNVLDIKFDSIAFSSEGLTMDGKLFGGVMDERGYYILDGLTHEQGDNTLKIIAGDFQGNTTEKTFHYSANLDMEQTFQ